MKHISYFIPPSTIKKRYKKAFHAYFSVKPKTKYKLYFACLYFTLRNEEKKVFFFMHVFHKKGIRKYKMFFSCMYFT